MQLACLNNFAGWQGGETMGLRTTSGAAGLAGGGTSQVGSFPTVGGYLGGVAELSYAFGIL